METTMILLIAAIMSFSRYKMPINGLGTYRLLRQEHINSVAMALEEDF